MGGMEIDEILVSEVDQSDNLEYNARTLDKLLLSPFYLSFQKDI